jgi:NAD(P)-dependent dehydrogenase (short-subunit alcohol dehydrogenase family)
LLSRTSRAKPARRSSANRAPDSTLEAFESTLEIGLKTNFLGMKYQIAQMLEQGGGVIANTTSLAGVRITPYSSPLYLPGGRFIMPHATHASIPRSRDCEGVARSCAGHRG